LRIDGLSSFRETVEFTDLGLLARTELTETIDGEGDRELSSEPSLKGECGNSLDRSNAQRSGSFDLNLLSGSSTDGMQIVR
jgi:hypothetical protein